MDIGNIDLMQYRKPIGMLVTGALIVALKYIGWEPQDLLVWGTNITDVQEAVLDFLVTIGIPAVIVIAQPNGPGCALVDHWQWVVTGMAVVAALIFIVGLL